MKKYLKATSLHVAKTIVKEEMNTLLGGSLLCFAANIFYSHIFIQTTIAIFVDTYDIGEEPAISIMISRTINRALV
jgi:hypothetical protein